jgi:hypothetical protein
MPARRAAVVPSRAWMPNWRRRRGGARCGGRCRHGDEAADDMPAHSREHRAWPRRRELVPHLMGDGERL